MNDIDFYKENLAIWFKKMEIDALRTSHDESPIGGFYDYWQGKAGAFSQGWERIVFDGRTVHPLHYNKANDRYSNIVNGEQYENRESKNNN